MPVEISLDKIKLQIAIVESELGDLQTKGKNSSSIRARAHLLLIKKQCDILRKETLAYHRALKEEKKNKPTENKAAEPVVAEDVVVVEPDNVVITAESVQPNDDDAPKVIKIKSRAKRRVPKGRKQRVA